MILGEMEAFLYSRFLGIRHDPGGPRERELTRARARPRPRPRGFHHLKRDYKKKFIMILKYDKTS